MSYQICLASQSPRRKELLERLGLSLEIVPADIDETPKPGELPQDHVLRLAVEKAKAVVSPLTTVAADTIVTIDGLILGKPNDYADFCRMMALLSAREHSVMTGWCVRNADHMIARVTTTRVRFQAISEPMMKAYWESGEPRGKAGGYAIQGGAVLWVSALAGDFNNVVGLPLTEVGHALAELGTDPLALLKGQYAR